MLILARKPGEKIIIADGIITLEVLDIRGNVVRLGIKADKDIPIYRAELQERRDKEKQSA